MIKYRYGGFIGHNYNYTANERGIRAVRQNFYTKVLGTKALSISGLQRALSY